MRHGTCMTTMDLSGLCQTLVFVSHDVLEDKVHVSYGIIYHPELGPRTNTLKVLLNVNIQAQRSVGMLPYVRAVSS